MYVSCVFQGRLFYSHVYYNIEVESNFNLQSIISSYLVDLQVKGMNLGLVNKENQHPAVGGDHKSSKLPVGKPLATNPVVIKTIENKIYIHICMSFTEKDNTLAFINYVFR